ncbi:uncharacterized protein [Panulirus ornatus]|uniref:uncharacterized protein isoform X2 n=1 Tax=Panulirus ornatus TaxID=150431 RepID=UPI003A85EC1F
MEVKRGVGLLLMLSVALASTTAIGHLRLEQSPRPPRVYAGAPSGVKVTVVRLVDDRAGSDDLLLLNDTRHGSQSSSTSWSSSEYDRSPRYHLHQSNSTDHSYFHIDELGGTITTARYVDRPAGEEYRLIVVALLDGKAINRPLTVAAAHYNKHTPKLSLQRYSAEVVVNAEVGTPLLTVRASDDDTVDYNSHVRYFLAENSLPFRLSPFLDPPKWSPVRVNAETGEVLVSAPLALASSPLELLVGAVDDGSPQRYDLANLTLYVRDMSAPLNVTVSNTSESSLTVCWSPPAHGRPQGYILTYTPAVDHESYGQGTLNLTTAELHATLFPQKHISLSEEGDDVVSGVMEIYRYCAMVGGLASWTEYVVGVQAWAGDRVSIATKPVLATTRSDYCAEGVCGKGNCTLQQSPPGYICSCPLGYYGPNCTHRNPCLPDNPCMHFGKCHNASDGSHTCECLRGFYGPECSQIDPCAAVSANPCGNGGTCVSQESGKYTCQCPKGYFGGTCEHQDPCVSSPCQHGGMCTNLTDTTFTCHCAPGYRGVECEVNINECSSSPCLNGATCIDGVASFMCLCIPGYTGKVCQAELNECVPNPCIRGNCTDLINDFFCDCPKGWGGKICDEDLDECASSPCLNGATCIDGLASFLCDCALGYSGQTCDIPESCPAQTTFLDTGEFHWPATRHGESVTITCPYGIRATSSDSISTSKLAMLPDSTTETTITDDYLTTIIPKMMSPEYEDGSSLQPLVVHPSEAATVHAEWEGGSFSMSRRARNVELPLHDHESNPVPPVPEVTDDEARRRLVAANLRGSLLRQSRRFQQERQHQRVGQGRKVKDRQAGMRENFQLHAGEGTIKRLSQHKGTAIIRQPQIRDTPVTEALTGEGFAEEHYSVESQFEQAGNEASKSSLVREISNIQPRAEKKHFDLPQIGGKHSVQQVIETDFEHNKKIVNNSEDFTVGMNDPTPPKIEKRYSENIKEKDFTEKLASDYDFSEKIENGEALINISSRTVKKSVDHSESKKILNEHVQSSKLTSASVTVTTPHEAVKFKEGVNVNSNKRTSPSSLVQDRPLGAFRSCELLPNGTVVWKEPDTWKCREQSLQAAEDAAKDVATLTASPATIDPQTFAHAAKELARICEHALHDPAVANNMVSALSNMMEVNDSVVAAGDENNITSQLVNTINTFVEKVPVDVGKSVKFRSSNLLVEARLLESSARDDVAFHPEFERGNSVGVSQSRRKRNTDSSSQDPLGESFLTLPSEALKVAGTEHVRLEFVSYANDKFFRGQRTSGMPVISAKITNAVISNLTEPVVYYIPTDGTEAKNSFLPLCVFWDELAHDWSEVGMKTVMAEGITTCHATHLTAFSILLDPLPSSLGAHADALSIITYVGLALSTAGLTATVATYAIFRTLNRDRSGKIVMNLSLALLLLNLVFIAAAQLEPPSIACTALAAALHYLVIAAFAWMLVEAANMYQLLITVFASAETHFMAKRVIAAWGIPVIVVVAALIADLDVYGDKNHGFCVISPIPNPAVYYSTYMAPICCVLLVNCIVFLMVTRVLCQRRPRSHKPRSPPRKPTKELPITLAQVRGAVTVVALLGVTWVAGAVSVGWARLTLQYIFCLTTPLQGLIIFIVRVAQHPEARAAWIAFFTTGTLRRRPQNIHTHFTHSSSNTHSTLSSAHAPLHNHHSACTTSTRLSPRTSLKPSDVQRNGSAKHSSNKNGSIKKYTSNSVTTDSNMGTMFSRLVSRLNSGGLDHQKSGTLEDETLNCTSAVQPTSDTVPASLSHLDYPESLHHESCSSEKFLQKSYYHSNKNSSQYRPQSLVLQRMDSHGDNSTTQQSAIDQDYIACQFPALLSTNLSPQELLEAGIPPSMIPRRSLGSLMLLSENKEGDDSSWHFVRPPPDGRSDPVSDGENPFEEANQIIPHSLEEHEENVNPAVQAVGTGEPLSSSGCVVLAGQRVATNHSAVFSGKQKGVCSPKTLIRANSELQMGSPHINSTELRRSASVYTLGEWEDPRSSLA